MAIIDIILSLKNESRKSSLTVVKATVRWKLVSGHPPACCSEGPLFGHCWHYYALRVLSTITNVYLSIRF